MLKLLGSSVVIVTVVFSTISFPISATPQKAQAGSSKEVYLGVSAEGTLYARDAYLLPTTIRPRGKLLHFQEHDVYHEIQESPFGYNYQQTMNFWVANCEEGLIGHQKKVDLDDQGKKLSELDMGSKLEVPYPGTTIETALDLVCNYK